MLRSTVKRQGADYCVRKLVKSPRAFTWLVVIFAQILFGLTLQVVVAPIAKAAGTCTSAFAADTLW